MTISKKQLDKFRKHLIDRDYMSGVDRDKARTNATQEVFTPTELVELILDDLDPAIFAIESGKNFMDNSCGDGQFLAAVLMRKLENGQDFEKALSSIYGVDLMPDNVIECRKRLLCGQDNLKHIVERNIVCENGLTYNYKFLKKDVKTTKVLKKIVELNERDKKLLQNGVSLS